MEISARDVLRIHEGAVSSWRAPEFRALPSGNVFADADLARQLAAEQDAMMGASSLDPVADEASTTVPDDDLDMELSPSSLGTQRVSNLRELQHVERETQQRAVENHPMALGSRNVIDSIRHQALGGGGRLPQPSNAWNAELQNLETPAGWRFNRRSMPYAAPVANSDFQQAFRRFPIQRASWLPPALAAPRAAHDSVFDHNAVP